MIEGIRTKSLRLIPDARGYLMEILRDDDEIFAGFGQCYVSATHPGIVKAWHAHRRQTDTFCCVHGNVRLGLWDAREDSPTRGDTDSLVIGDLNRVAVQIPPGVWHGWLCLGNELAIVLNVPNQRYDYDDPDEVRRPWDDPEIGFDWHIRGG